MEILIEIVSSVVGKIAECTVTPVVHQLGYFFHYERNIRNLRSQIQQLIHEKEKLQHLVIEATNRGDEIVQDVRDWLTNADELVKKSEIFFKEEGQANTRCSGYGTFPNMVLRRRLSRKAEKMAVAAGSEIREVQNIFQNKVTSYRGTLPSSAKIHETFESRISTLTKVMDALRDPTVNRIGVHGMAGVGKTTLAKAVEQQALEERLFDVVVMVPISQTPNFHDIQQIIADKLGLDLREKTVPTRAERLLDQLMKQDKKILVILDDVWKQLSLRDIGLISSGDDRKGFKMLLTSRFLNVCRQMDVDKSFEVGILIEGEALNLFKKVNGDTCQSQDVQDFVADIVKECAGLPLAITTIASALKGKRCSVWADVLRELRGSSSKDIDGMEIKVYASIRMSYDFLGSDEERSLLVFCSLHREDAEIQIHQLLRYGLGFGLFEGITTLEEAINKLFNWVDHLMSSSLLLNGRSPDFVKLHDVVRDVLISIAAKSKRMYLIKDAVKPEEYVSKFGDSVAISLLNSNFDQLPKRSVCEQLKLLFMFGSGISSQILDKVVFEKTSELRVLLLTSIHLGRLQSCFRALENLQTLCLNGCRLEDIASIGELKHLKVLDLARSEFEELPREIGQLTSLRLLDLSYCYQLRTIKPNVISSLTNLEELNLRESFTSWEVLDKVDGERSNASLVELSNLSQLSALYIRVEDASVVPKDKWLSDKLKRYEILIGEVTYWLSDEDETSRRLGVRLEHSWQLDEYKIQTLVKTSEELWLGGLVGLGDVVPGLDKDGFPHLKRLSFGYNDQIRYIVNLRDYMKNTSAFPFPKLESLRLWDLRNLEGVCQWHGNKNEAIDGVELEGKIEFPQLRRLKLEGLPKLKQFCPAPDDEFTKRTNSATNIADTNSIPLFNPKVCRLIFKFRKPQGM
ncbi:hypothetical protein TIFTF001_045361 [Ficus carica]|uniref:AAA+ ATPase domain-containing protein n=1 Tax=Ficus carica TaxID=3494 RepID=A0AA87YQB7_FICCA|nr:hypothetical protein TIFTF001_045360 [Ficus carica]GMN20654.1 hypothetical protein TIFTF001_045361 [Ficus carica]